MSDSAEMARLMNHAAELLHRARVELTEATADVLYKNERWIFISAAMANARATLRMVAACVTETPHAAPPPGAAPVSASSAAPGVQGGVPGPTPP